MQDKRMEYSMQLSMLKLLFREKLITEEEYNRVLKRLKKDFGIVSDLLA